MNKSFILLITLLLYNCGTHKFEKGSDIQLYLKNKKVVDNSDLEIVIKNNSKEDYYLLLNTTLLQDPLKYFNVDINLTSLNDWIEDSDGKNVNLVLTSEFESERTIHQLKDIFKINSGQEKTLTIPFNLKVCLAQDYCVQYETKMMDSKKKYYVYVQYRADKEYIKNALQKNIKDSLEIMGYKMFDKTIKSNRVELDYKIE